MANQNHNIALIQQLNNLSSRLASADTAASAASEALQLSRELTASLAPPETLALELIHKPLLTTAARIAIDMGLFRHIASSQVPLDLKTLASLTSGEELLIIRILRVLASIGFVLETGLNTWEATPVTKVMATEYMEAGHRLLFDTGVRAAQAGPAILRETGYTCPTDNTWAKRAYQTELSVWEYLSTNPQHFKDFNTFMGNTLGAKKYWFDWFPIQEHVIDGANPSSALIVDVGGGNGHDLLAFHAKYPNQGRLVLQDVEPVIKSLTTLDPAVEATAYNFFTPQPVKGARVYSFHHILHDWPDKECVSILENVTKAMVPGYSKLLIHELIVPETNADTLYGTYDFVMMASFGGMERTQTQFEKLLDRVGLKVVKVWLAPEVGGDGVVEAMLKD